eukprot:1097169-Pleurochrysis_carterae.AAC.2
MHPVVRRCIHALWMLVRESHRACVSRCVREAVDVCEHAGSKREPQGRPHAMKLEPSGESQNVRIVHLN